MRPSGLRGYRVIIALIYFWEEKSLSLESVRECFLSFLHHKLLTPVIVRIVLHWKHRKTELYLCWVSANERCPRTEINKLVIFVVDLAHLLRTLSIDQFLMLDHKSSHAHMNGKDEGYKKQHFCFLTLGDIILSRKYHSFLPLWDIHEVGKRCVD